MLGRGDIVLGQKGRASGRIDNLFEAGGGLPNGTREQILRAKTSLSEITRLRQSAQAPATRKLARP